MTTTTRSTPTWTPWTSRRPRSPVPAASSRSGRAPSATSARRRPRARDAGALRRGPDRVLRQRLLGRHGGAAAPRREADPALALARRAGHRPGGHRGRAGGAQPGGRGRAVLDVHGPCRLATRRPDGPRRRLRRGRRGPVPGRAASSWSRSRAGVADARPRCARLAVRPDDPWRAGTGCRRAGRLPSRAPSTPSAICSTWPPSGRVCPPGSTAPRSVSPRSSSPPCGRTCWRTSTSARVLDTPPSTLEARGRASNARFGVFDPTGEMAAECWRLYQRKLAAWTAGVEHRASFVAAWPANRHAWRRAARVGLYPRHRLPRRRALALRRTVPGARHCGGPAGQPPAPRARGARHPLHLERREPDARSISQYASCDGLPGGQGRIRSTSSATNTAAPTRIASRPSRSPSP